MISGMYSGRSMVKILHRISPSMAAFFCSGRPAGGGCVLFCLAVVFSFGAASWADAGMLVNRDKKVYKYSIFWDDMSVPVRGEIGPSEKVSFPDKPATVELIGKRDNIYVRAQETLFIQNGVMRRH